MKADLCVAVVMLFHHSIRLKERVNWLTPFRRQFAIERQRREQGEIENEV